MGRVGGRHRAVPLAAISRAQSHRELDVPAGELVGDGARVGQRSHQPVELGHHELVAGASPRERLAKSTRWRSRASRCGCSEASRRRTAPPRALPSPDSWRRRARDSARERRSRQAPDDQAEDQQPAPVEANLHAGHAAERHARVEQPLVRRRACVTTTPARTRSDRAHRRGRGLAGRMYVPSARKIDSRSSVQRTR